MMNDCFVFFIGETKYFINHLKNRKDEKIRINKFESKKNF